MLPRLARTYIGRIPVFVRPFIFVVIPVVAFHPWWSAGSSDAGARERPQKLEAERRPASTLIPAEEAREAIERNEQFPEVKKAICPRRVADRSEMIRQYPAIAALQSLNYITMTNDTSRGTYEKVIEITQDARFDLMRDLVEEDAQYVITIAERSYVPSSEVIHTVYREGQPDESSARVQFRWIWQPVNKAGQRFSLGPRTGGGAYNGWAIFTRSATGWELTELHFDKDDRNYMQPQY